MTSSGAGGRGAPSLRTQVRSGRGSPVTRQLTTPPVLLVKVRLGGRGRSSSGPYESAHSTAPGPQQLLYTVAHMRACIAQHLHTANAAPVQRTAPGHHSTIYRIKLSFYTFNTFISFFNSFYPLLDKIVSSCASH